MNNMLNQIDMDNILMVSEVIRAMMAWEFLNKYYNGKYQIIKLTNFNNEIYVAHNIYTDVIVESAYDFISTIKDMFKQYVYDEESKEYLKEFWIPRLEQILEIQDNL